MKIMSDTSSSEEEDSQELQRLKDAAVTLQPDGDLHASQNVSTKSGAMNEVANSTKVSQTRSSLRPSLRPKQTYSEDTSSELKVAPGFRTHVAKKLSDILDKELEFAESDAGESSEKKKSSSSGIRLLSSSKKFLKVDPNADITKLRTDQKWTPVWKPRSHSKRDNPGSSSASRKRVKPNGSKETNSSSDSSDEEMLAEAAVSFQDIKDKDELLSSFATPRAPILIIRLADKCHKDKRKTDIEREAQALANGEPIKKKKKKKKKHKEKTENSIEEEKGNKEKELGRKNKKEELCSRNDSLENNEVNPVKEA